MQTTQLEVSFVSALPPNAFDGKWRWPIQLLYHHALLDLGYLLGCHCQAKSCGEGYLLPVEPGYAFQRLVDVGLK